MDHDKALRQHLLELLRGGHAHLTFDDAVRDFPRELRGAKPKDVPHSAWQLLEHLRLAQRDILDFSRNENGEYRELKWPDDYWPKSAAPPDEGAWDKSVAEVSADARAFEHLIQDPGRDLFAKFSWGDGQTLLREALLLADHNSYHTGQLAFLRKLLSDRPIGRG